MSELNSLNFHKKSRLDNLIDPDHASYYNKSRIKRYRLKQKYGTSKKYNSQGYELLFNKNLDKITEYKSSFNIPKGTILIDGNSTVAKSPKVIINSGNSKIRKSKLGFRMSIQDPIKKVIVNPDVPQIRKIDNSERLLLITVHSKDYRHIANKCKKRIKNALDRTRKYKLNIDENSIDV